MSSQEEIQVEKIQDLINEATTHYNKGDMEKAISILQFCIKEGTALKKHRIYYEIHLSLASLLYLEIKPPRFEEAIEVLENAIKIDDTLIDAFKELSIIYAIKEDKDTAILFSEKMMARDGYMSVTNAISTSGITENSIKAMKQVLALDPNFYDGHIVLGVMLMKKEDPDFENAQSMFKKAIEINNMYPSAFFNLGNLFLSQGKYVDAIKQYKEAQTRIFDTSMNLFKKATGEALFAKGEKTFFRWRYFPGN